MRFEVLVLWKTWWKVATKRYTKARVRRILTYILVGAIDQALPDAIHVLGFFRKGQAHLKGLKNQ